MKALTIIGTTALFLLLGSNVPVFAQEHQEEAKPAQHEEQAQPAKQETQRRAAAAKPAQERTQAKAATQEKQSKPAQRQEQANSTKPEAQTKPVKQAGLISTAAPQHPQRTAAEQQRQRSVPALRLSASSGRRIPDARFRSTFGRGREFSIGTPRLVDGTSRFQYGGYWFGFVQPWPLGWYYTDNVYVDYIDGGYYLCNPYFPDARVAISIVG